LLKDKFQRSDAQMQHSTAPVLFESTGDHAVVQDPVNEDWVALVAAIGDKRFDVLARRYYLALYHFRKQRARPALPGRTEVEAQNRQQAFEGILGMMEQRKASCRRAKGPLPPDEVFVEPVPEHHARSLHDALADFSVTPPPMSQLLDGAGRPPCDALCLLRAFLAAPLLGVGDDPTSVHQLLHSNPAFAHLCGFLGSNVMKQPGELTSRRLPSSSTCAEFSEVMTRYGLWYQARLEQVAANLASGVVETEKAVSFDTTHLEANSHCGNVETPNAKVEAEAKPKHRKVPRMHKRCDCGKDNWESCIHAWVPTDQGAAVVVKGPTRVYWAHKASVAAFADSEIPIDVRVCRYAAEHDSRTLVPHLELLKRDLPQVVLSLLYLLADDGYQGNAEEVARFGRQARLIVPVHPRKARVALAEEFDGIDRFTAVGFPICEGGHRFELRGRDIVSERYIWVAPDDEQGRPVCADCPFAQGCLKKGRRRHIRVDRKDQPQIDWNHPQLFARDRARYQKRTGVERAIKRLKVDLNGEQLTHRDALRVQAHLDRKLLTLHLLLEVAASP
jgi:hypothetical protein